MDNVLLSISDWIKETIETAVDFLVKKKLEDEDAVLLTRQEVADRLSVSVTTFDKYYRYNPDLGFPKELPACRWPKPAIIRWINEQN